jgi:L-ascorbate metabolism protein UlaG (beta-lactamase superfamily)
MKLKILLILCITFYSLSCSSSGPYRLSDHYDGRKFHNIDPTVGPKGFFDILKWKLSFDEITWQSPKALTPSTLTLQDPPADKMIVTFINHASFLVQVDGVNLLTDPVWSNRTSPVSFAGPKRFESPGITIANLPKIHVVVISHNHYDHMDADTIRDLETHSSPLFIVPLGNAEKVKSFGATKVHEMDWWESININPDFKVILTPAQHWSSRTPFDRNLALWGSFFIEAKKEKIYFAGDTGYGSHFKEIRKRLFAPTLSLLPIGAYEPRWFMKSSHMNPEDAVLAHIDLESPFSIGMHFGTFQLTDEAQDQPVKDLEVAIKKYNIQKFEAPKAGQAFSF